MEPEFSALAGGFFITEWPILQLKEKKKLKKNKAGQRRKFEVKGWKDHSNLGDGGRSSE